MTFQGDGEGDGIVAKIGMGEVNGEYVRLCEDEGTVGVGVAVEACGRRWFSPWWLGKVVLVCSGLLVGAAVFFVWGFPFLLKKVVVPILDWECRTFSTTALMLILFISIAIFPAIMLPSSPSIWLAVVTYGYVYGFILITTAEIVGMSLPFFIGSLFQHRIHRWLERWPKKAAVIRLAGEGDWTHQFRAVTLIRISPFPYIIFNYASVATNVKYCPYIFGSIVGTIPDNLIAMYSGILLRNLAEASDGRGFITPEQVIFDVIGFCIALTSTTAITVYAKRTLQTIQAEDELV